MGLEIIVPHGSKVNRELDGSITIRLPKKTAPETTDKLIPTPYLSTETSSTLKSVPDEKERRMAFTWLTCNNCGARIKSHLQCCPVCKKSKPFTCGTCRRQIQGPLQHGLGVNNGIACCNSCIQKKQKPPRPITIQPRPRPKPKPKYGSYFSHSGVTHLDWYSQGYNHGFEDAKAGKAHSTASHYNFAGCLATLYKDYSKGYSDGYRAGRQ